MYLHWGSHLGFPTKLTIILNLLTVVGLVSMSIKWAQFTAQYMAQVCHDDQMRGE